MYVPDNYDAFEAREAEQEAWLARRPRCCSCKNPIQDDYLFDIDDSLYCEKCMIETFRQDAEDYEG